MRILATIGAASLLAGVIVTAQAPVPNPTNKTGVIGLMHAIHSTNDVEKTLAFYQAVFGLNGQVRPFQSTGPQILTNSPGATLRVAMTQLKGAFNFELTEFGSIERQLNKQPDIADRHQGWRAGGRADVTRRDEGDHHARSGRLFRRSDPGETSGGCARRSGHRRHHGTDRRRHGRNAEILEWTPRTRAPGRQGVLEQRRDARSDGTAEGRVLSHGGRA